MNDKEKLLRDWKRMCKAYGACSRCAITQETGEEKLCLIWAGENPIKAIKVIEKWAAEHPVKTRQSEFLGQFPNAEMNEGALTIMPCSIDTRLVQTDCCNNSSNCQRCRKEYWSQEVENE